MNGVSPVRVVIADDHRVLVDALCAFFAGDPRLEVVGRVETTDRIPSVVREQQPHVLLLDLEMPGGEPLDAALTAKSRAPQTRVLVLTAFASDTAITRAQRLGVAGILTKVETAEEVAEAIVRVARGEAVFSAAVRERLAAHEAGVAEGTTRMQSLTERELQVVRLAAQGLTTNQIADTLCRSPKTIERHLQAAMDKLDIHNRVELARWAIREGLSQL